MAETTTTPSPSPDVPFEIGLVMAGAVSAGAYTAGVIDFLIQALDEWEKAKEQARKDLAEGKTTDCPMHEVRIKVMAGASAGGMTAALAAGLVGMKFQSVTSLPPTGHRFEPDEQQPLPELGQHDRHQPAPRGGRPRRPGRPPAVGPRLDDPHSDRQPGARVRERGGPHGTSLPCRSAARVPVRDQPPGRPLPGQFLQLPEATAIRDDDAWRLHALHARRERARDGRRGLLARALQVHRCRELGCAPAVGAGHGGLPGRPGASPAESFSGAVWQSRVAGPRAEDDRRQDLL